MSRLKSRPGTWGPTIPILLTLFALAACGAATPPSLPLPSGPTPSVTAPIDLPITIALAGSFDDQTLALLDRQIAAFEASNPDIKVEVVFAPRPADERRLAFADYLGIGDTSRDIYAVSPTWLAEFAAHGWLVPSGDYVKSLGMDTGAFFPASIEANTVGGRLLALPWTADGGILYYRQDLLDRYGYEPPVTWPELQRVALDVRTREGLQNGFVWQGAAGESLTCNSLEFVWAYGGDILDPSGTVIFHSDGTRAALRQMADLISTGASPREVATYQEAATLAAFQAGEAVLMRNWAYAWDRLDGTDSAVAGKIAIAPLPASCLGGTSLALSVHSQHPQEAARFMAFLLAYEQQAQLALEGVQPPALRSIYEDGDLLATEPTLQALYAALSVTRPRPQSAHYAELSEIIYSEVNAMLRGEQDAATTAAQVQRRLERLLAP